MKEGLNKLDKKNAGPDLIVLYPDKEGTYVPPAETRYEIQTIRNNALIEVNTHKEEGEATPEQITKIKGELNILLGEWKFKSRFTEVSETDLGIRARSAIDNPDTTFNEIESILKEVQKEIAETYLKSQTKKTLLN